MQQAPELPRRGAAHGPHVRGREVACKKKQKGRGAEPRACQGEDGEETGETAEKGEEGNTFLGRTGGSFRVYRV